MIPQKIPSAPAERALQDRDEIPRRLAGRWFFGSCKVARCAGILAGSALIQAHAASRTWDNDGVNLLGLALGESGTWNNTSTNWDPGSGFLGLTGSAWNNNDTAVFGGTAGVVTISGTVIANGLTFNVAGYSITGGTLTMAGGTPSINTNAVGATISATISGSVGIIKTGGSTLTLSDANNNYTGVTDVRNGSVHLSGGSLSGATTLNLGNSTTSGKFILGGASGAINQTVAGLTVSGSGTTNTVVGGNASISTFTVNKTSGSDSFSGMLGGALANENQLALVKSGGGSLTLTGANTYAGGTTISAGTLAAANASALGSGNLLINGGSLASSVTGVSTGSITMGSGSLSANGAAAGAYALGLNADFIMSGGTLEISLLSASSFDKIQGTGIDSSFSLTGGILDLTGSVTDYAATYQVFDGFADGFVSNLAIINYDSSTYTAHLADSGVLSFAAIPEPGVFGLGGLGSLFLLMHRRRNDSSALA